MYKCVLNRSGFNEVNFNLLSPPPPHLVLYFNFYENLTYSYVFYTSTLLLLPEIITPVNELMTDKITIVIVPKL